MSLNSNICPKRDPSLGYPWVNVALPSGSSSPAQGPAAALSSTGQKAMLEGGGGGNHVGSLQEDLAPPSINPQGMNCQVFIKRNYPFLAVSPFFFFHRTFNFAQKWTKLFTFSGIFPILINQPMFSHVHPKTASQTPSCHHFSSIPWLISGGAFPRSPSRWKASLPCRLAWEGFHPPPMRAPWAIPKHAPNPRREEQRQEHARGQGRAAEQAGDHFQQEISNTKSSSN